MSREFGNAIRLGWIVALAAVATSTAAVPAAAEPSGDATISIDYRDLDLSTRAGVDTLYHRIVSASRRVCPNLPVAGLAVQQVVVRECREAAVAGAVAQVHSAGLAIVRTERRRRN